MLRRTALFSGALTLFAVALIVTLVLGGCRSAIPNRNPVGERFPRTSGTTLDGDELELPAAVAGSVAVFLVGYEQDAQFDADRWAFGLLQARTPVRILELPAIPGLLPKLASSFIDKGMRGGIPEEDWAAVVTLYGGAAEPVAEFTGTTDGQNMRVLLLDREGVVRWFHDQGFSAGRLLELDRSARALAEE